MLLGNGTRRAALSPPPSSPRIVWGPESPLWWPLPPDRLGNGRSLGTQVLRTLRSDVAPTAEEWLEAGDMIVGDGQMRQYWVNLRVHRWTLTPAAMTDGHIENERLRRVAKLLSLDSTANITWEMTLPELDDLIVKARKVQDKEKKKGKG